MRDSREGIVNPSVSRADKYRVLANRSLRITVEKSAVTPAAIRLAVTFPTQAATEQRIITPPYHRMRGISMVTMTFSRM